MKVLSAALYIGAYLLAVVDGSMQDKGVYPSSPGRTGFRAYIRSHRWIAAGALCGAAGTVAALLA